MASDDKPARNGDANFSFAVRELQQAERAEGPSLDGLSLDASNENRGFDPYNSGTFDRAKYWARVGKR